MIKLRKRTNTSKDFLKNFNQVADVYIEVTVIEKSKTGKTTTTKNALLALGGNKEQS